ncbi:MAG: exodeoxyribonuclease III, partial [Candidatus Zixiibacteriota bacterium]
GLRAIHKKGFLGWFHDMKPDIMCLQETKAQPEQLPEELRKIDGYHVYYCAAERKGYSGVALYSSIKPLKVTNGLGIERFDSEGRTIMAEYENFILFNIYYPNGKASKERLQYKLDFYDAFLVAADRLLKQKKNLVICGDVNTAHKEIDLARPKENVKVSGFLPEERAWMDKFFEHGFVDTLRVFDDRAEQYTWWDMKSRARERNIGWRIDYFFISESLRKNLKAGFILPEITGSDHCPIGIEISL